MNEKKSVRSLKGIGEKTERLFQKAGVSTVEDLIRFYPRTYDLYEKPATIAQLEEGRVMTVSGGIFGRVQVSAGSRIEITTLHLKDLTGTLKVVWYRMPFLRNTLSKGGVLTLRGKVARKKDELVMEQPEIFYPASRYGEKEGTLQPVYPLTEGLTNNAVMKAVKQALSAADPGEGILPEELQETYSLISYRDALRGIHFPKDKEEYLKARKRLAFEEFLVFILSVRLMKEQKESLKNPFVFREQPALDAFIKSLPFELTGAQTHVWREIHQDMRGVHVMARLVQGDVGSGKTIVAVLAMLYAGLNGYQAALMAPTEVLARQHFEAITSLFAERGIPIKTELVTGSMTAAQKRNARERIASGEATVIIGTHALIQEGVEYKNLALVVTDEQHRFGVKQREALAGKGTTPHILVMSATPIPRTLALILYGDMDISVMKELPKNRLPIKNCVVDTGYRPRAYQFMKRQISYGRQCYVICPMVEESDAMEAENVMDYAAALQKEMGADIHVQYLHGKMKAGQKEEIMESFLQNQIQILVSTTVIEVGIDVPNATVILIENAERFGLAQLHQLRGRVGRGACQSYCVFMTPSKSEETKKRLEILNHSNDGFLIAEQDMKLRGPGDIFGIRQSGILNFKLADVFQDSELLKQAAQAAGTILRKDPGLKGSTYEKLRKEVERRIDLHGFFC